MKFSIWVTAYGDVDFIDVQAIRAAIAKTGLEVEAIQVSQQAQQTTFVPVIGWQNLEIDSEEMLESRIALPPDENGIILFVNHQEFMKKEEERLQKEIDDREDAMRAEQEEREKKILDEQRMAELEDEEASD